MAQMVIIDPPIIVPPQPIPHPRRPVETVLEVVNQVYSTAITDGVARTKVDQTFHNPYPQRIEGTYFYPLPADASVGGFSMFVNGRELKGEVLERQEARRIYQNIVSKMRDPALLEYMGSRLYRAKIFPIPANDNVRVTLQYTQSLDIDGGLMSLVLPMKGDSRSSKPASHTSVVVNISGQTPIKSVFSPSHAVSVHRASEFTASVSFESNDARSEKDFVLHTMLSDESFGLAWLTYREAGEDGYFMARIAPKSELSADDVLAKDVSFVFDTSGSMAGAKIRQAREALRFCLSRLNVADRFNVITFSHEPRAFRDAVVLATAENVAAATSFVQDASASGGTNINDALLAAIKGIPAGDSSRPHLIVFLTDGMPTVGETRPERILKAIQEANTTRARLFVFGVGVDVNTKLLDRLAEEQRGARQYVSPGENLEVKLSSFFRKVSDPVMSDLALAWGGISVRDVFPRRLPDLFAGGEIVIVGRYSGSGSCAIELTGRRANRTQQYTYERAAATGETKHDFLPRLWATRKIGYLLDEMRLHGENAELKNSVIQLAKRFGIVTPYTAYLVTEDEKLARSGGRREQPPSPMTRAIDQLGAYDAADRPSTIRLRYKTSGTAQSLMRQGRRGFQADTGAGAVDASMEVNEMKFAGAVGVTKPAAKTKDDRTRKIGARLSMKRIGGRTFYLLEGRWVESGFDEKAAVHKIELFSKAYFDLLAKHPKLAKVLALGQRVVFRLDGKWYETHATQQ